MLTMPSVRRFNGKWKSVRHECWTLCDYFGVEDDEQAAPMGRDIVH